MTRAAEQLAEIRIGGDLDIIVSTTMLTANSKYDPDESI